MARHEDGDGMQEGEGYPVRHSRGILVGVVAVSVCLLVGAWIWGLSDYHDCLGDSDPAFRAANGMDKMSWDPSNTPEASRCASDNWLPRAVLR